MAVRRDVKSMTNMVGVEELELAINLALYGVFVHLRQPIHSTLLILFLLYTTS